MICKKCGKGSFYTDGKSELCQECCIKIITNKYCDSHILGNFIKYTDKGRIRIVKCIVYGCCFEQTEDEFNLNDK